MPQSHELPSPASPGYDPVFKHAWRESKVALVAWLVFGFWVVGYSWWRGRAPDSEADELALVWGMPAWVFWGVAVPWILANVFTFWFCFRFMADAPLREVKGEQAVCDQRASRP